MGTLTVYGIKKLKVSLEDKKKLTSMKKIVHANGATLHEEMTREAKFVGGYSTGRTKRSIDIRKKSSGLSVIVKPTTEYAPYLEYGTRYMEKQSFVKPAFQKVKKQFIKDLEDLV